MTTTTEENPTRVVAVIGLLSVAVCGAVAFVLYALPARSGVEPGVLPTLNAALNAASAACLVAGWRMIRTGRRSTHRAFMLCAVGLSTAFLVGYLVHHARVGSIPFRGQGLVRTVYFAILIPHIVLAAAVLPMALLTLYRALTERFDRHRRLARWTLPLWLYVSVSGVVVYLFLYHWPV
jgi:protein SCO1/2/putative membrane protein